MSWNRFGLVVALGAVLGALCPVYAVDSSVVVDDGAAVAFDRVEETVVRNAEGRVVEAFIDVGGYRFERALDLDGDFSAACRVAVSGARGSGCFVGASDGKCLVLTNYHVVEKATKAVLQFLGTGDRIEVNGTILARWYNAQALYDFALIGVEPAEMAKTGAKYIPLGGSDVRPAVNSYILSAGAPKGRFVQAWRGKVLDYYNGSTCLFEPGPVPGQSGSAIVSEIDGELWVTGVLTWLIGTEGADDSKGGAIPISKLYEAARGKKASYPVGESPIPPNAKECLLDFGTQPNVSPNAARCAASGDSPNSDPVEVAKKSDVPFVFEFTMDGCEPCKRAASDVEAIRANGIPVYCLNVSTSKDSERRADELRVAKYPTFVVFSAEGKEVARFEGAGVSPGVINAAKGALPPIQEPSLLDGEALDPPQPPVDEEADPLATEKSFLKGYFESGDFRNREPVEQPADVDFFDDSDARWNNRNRGETPPRPETPQTPPSEPQSPPPSIDEGKLGDRIGGILGGRLKGDLKDSLGQEINGALDDLEKRFDKKIEDKMNEIGGKLLGKYEKLKFRVFMWFIGSIIVSVFFAEAVKALVSLVWSWIRSKFRALVNLEAARIAERASKLAAITAPKGDALASIDAGVDEIPEN